MTLKSYLAFLALLCGFFFMPGIIVEIAAGGRLYAASLACFGAGALLYFLSVLFKEG